MTLYVLVQEVRYSIGFEGEGVITFPLYCRMTSFLQSLYLIVIDIGVHVLFMTHGCSQPH